MRVIDPADGREPYGYDRDVVMVLSDWPERSPDFVYSRLKNGAEYYNYQKRTLGDFARDVAEDGVLPSVQFQDAPELELGSGITSYEAGLRLRYEFAREFALYVGVSWTETVGETADLLPEDAETGELSAVVGLRFWF